MSFSTVTPNMNLVVPTVGQEPGPQWASDLNASLSTIDGHNHSAGSGVQINPNGININADLPFNGTNNAISLRSARFTPQGSALSGVSDLGCLYEAGVDLYYNDGAGNQIRITQSGSVAGSSGTITGLPSGTASAAYSSGSGTFVFQQSTGTAANLDIGTIILRYPGSYPSPSGNFIALEAPTSLSGGYSLVFPATTPGTSGAFITASTAGVLSYTNVDNSTLAWATGVISVKTGGITRAQEAAVGQQISSSCGVFNGNNTSPTNVTNLSVTLTTTGRPVMLFLQNDGSANPSTFSPTGSGDVDYIRVLRGATEIFRYSFNIGSATSVEFPAGMFLGLDVPSAAANTYQVQAWSTSSGFIIISYFKLVAYEL